MTRRQRKVRRAQHRLRRCGWPIKADGRLGMQTATAIMNFKQGYAFYPGFRRTTKSLGPLTMRRLKKCAKRNGKCSRHFYFWEFKSKGNGWIVLRRELVRGLEKYRKLVGDSIAIVSGYRDPAHNGNVGGAPDSEHLDGTAADLVPAVSGERVRKLRRFSGIGIQSQTGLVRHVDVRGIPKGDDNQTGGTRRSPTIWFY